MNKIGKNVFCSIDSESTQQNIRNMYIPRSVKLNWFIIMVYNNYQK